MGGIDRDDPFAIFHMPPPNETAEEKASRERSEAEAQRVSDRIDDKIKLEKAALKKQQRDLVRVLLLGQSESGKSTTLKSEFISRILRYPVCRCCYHAWTQTSA
jgi:guanine nucleotide-binding protein alpha-1 subunit